MKKHFTGIALFIFIIGISGFIANLFVQIPTPKVFEITKTIPRYEDRAKCKKNYHQSEQSRVKLIQTVYNEKKKRIWVEVFMENPSTTDSNEIKLHFFMKDGNRTRFVSTETISLRSASDIEKDMLSQHGYFQFDSLKKLKSCENLYVIAEAYSSAQKGRLVYKDPEFDENKASAVLIEKIQ